MDPTVVENSPVAETKTLHARMLSGSLVLLLGSGLATLTNFIYNIAVARFLGPDGYGHATAVYTLLILISAATLSFQIVSAKLVAQQETPEGQHAVYRAFHRASWICGLAIGAALFLCRQPIASYLNLPDPALVSLLALGAAFYVPLGSRRGYIQGACGFRNLATNLALEGVLRLLGSLLLIRLGFGVNGVIAANSAAVAVAWLVIRPGRVAVIPNPVLWSDAFRETTQAMVFFSGQVLIYNWNIVLVKHFFDPHGAGLYAAVAMVGRVISTCSSAVVNSMFPLVAGTRGKGRKRFTVLSTSLLLTLAVGGLITLGLGLAPASTWTTFLGRGFALSGKYGLPYLMVLYAVTTVVYSLCVVIITYEMSYRIANTSWVQLAFSGIIIAAICRYHSTLQEVIWVQLVLMVALLAVVALPFILKTLAEARALERNPSLQPIRIVRRLAEDEVIAEFLKADFNSPAFHAYRDLEGLVLAPNLEDQDENAKRRALFFIRHLALWKELPRDTEWFEVEVRARDLPNVRFFPRAQWRRLARGDFSVTAVAGRMRKQQDAIEPAFRAKLEAISERQREPSADLGAIVLIGLTENEPVTVLDGNHRLAAAVLSTPEAIGRLRFLCGLSPRMMECCWYNTSLVTLLRYGRNTIAHLVRDPEAELARLLQSAS